jgi:G:T-mismatch repair DNA endonuclease (very short patch repair protein)
MAKKEYECPKCLKISLLAESSWKEAKRLKRLCRSCAMNKWQEEKYGKKTDVEFTSTCFKCGKIKFHKQKNLSPTQTKHISNILSKKMCKSCSNSEYYTLSKKKKNTKPERELKSILKELNIKFKHSYKYQGYYFDFYLPELNILIEVDGNYWHGKGLKWEELNAAQQNSRLNDIKKNQLCLDTKQSLIRLWEDEIEKQHIYNKIISYEKRTYTME